MLEYRGYGLSQGSPGEEGLYMDARTALDFLSLRRDVNHKKIIVFGRSLGKAVQVVHYIFNDIMKIDSVMIIILLLSRWCCCN
jgi:fermentation-respiration switch protein FrsA (DUF1100 family)